MQLGLDPGDEGWWEDCQVHVEDWGFSFDDIAVPVQLWHGRHDKFVPFQHGEWLAKQIPGVEAHLSDDDGHLTLLSKLREIHAWLRERLDGSVSAVAGAHGHAHAELEQEAVAAACRRPPRRCGGAGAGRPAGRARCGPR